MTSTSEEILPTRERSQIIILITRININLGNNLFYIIYLFALLRGGGGGGSGKFLQ